MNIGSLLKQIPAMPDLEGMMNGYVFKDNTIKMGVDYWRSNNKDIDLVSGYVVLKARDKVTIKQNESNHVILTDLSLLIHANNMAFIYFLTLPDLINEGVNFITPKIKERPFFSVQNLLPIDYVISEGDTVGIGVFIPFVSTNNVSLNNQNAPT